MGLDQYLTRKVFVGAEYKHRNVKAEISVTVNGRKLNIDQDAVSYVEESLGYWRKANAIHSWFVNNVQDGKDDCQSYYVDMEKIEELKQICERVVSSTKLVQGKVWNGQKGTPSGWEDIWEDGMVLEDTMVAEEHLPTQDGFFFGGVGYDEYYWQNLLDTIEICKKALEKADDGTEFYYRSSW